MRSGSQVQRTRKHSVALACASAAALCLALAGCNATPIEKARTGNTGVTADLIAHIGGCDLYRVYDGGTRVYLSVCAAASSRVRWDEGCGKGCARSAETLSPTTPGRD